MELTEIARSAIPADRCPCCGGKVVAPVNVEGLKHVPLTGLAGRILTELLRAYPKPLETERLVDKVYWDRPDGGPGDGRATVQATITQRLRPALARIGWGVGSRGKKSGIALWLLDGGAVSPTINTRHINERSRAVPTNN